MNKSPSLKPLDNSREHDCFGCSPLNPYGLQMKFFSDDQALFSWLTVPGHLCGWDSLVHGGVVATILDEIMGWTIIHFLKKFGLTNVITVEFHKHVQVGEQIRAEGRVLEVKAKRQATVEGRLYKGENTLCAQAVGTFRLFTARAVSRLGIMQEEAIKKFEFLIEQ